MLRGFAKGLVVKAFLAAADSAFFCSPILTGSPFIPL